MTRTKITKEELYDPDVALQEELDNLRFRKLVTRTYMPQSINLITNQNYLVLGDTELPSHPYGGSTDTGVVAAEIADFGQHSLEALPGLSNLCALMQCDGTPFRNQLTNLFALFQTEVGAIPGQPFSATTGQRAQLSLVYMNEGMLYPVDPGFVVAQEIGYFYHYRDTLEGLGDSSLLQPLITPQFSIPDPNDVTQTFYGAQINKTAYSTSGSSYVGVATYTFTLPYSGRYRVSINAAAYPEDSNRSGFVQMSSASLPESIELEYPYLEISTDGLTQSIGCVTDIQAPGDISITVSIRSSKAGNVFYLNRHYVDVNRIGDLA